MRAVDAHLRLEELLAARGVALADDGRARRGAGADARSAWEAFCEAAREPVEPRFTLNGRPLTVPDDPDCDLLLFETGWGTARPAAGGGWAPDGSEPAAYLVYLTRQFSFHGADGEYAGMHALTVTIEFAGSSGSLEADEECWGHGGPAGAGVSDWAARAESSEGFRAFEALVPQRFFVEQGPI